MINIVRKGIWPIPDEVKICPVCKNLINSFELNQRQYPNPYEYKLHDEHLLAEWIQYYPTFTCNNCKTIWQYFGEKEEEKE